MPAGPDGGAGVSRLIAAFVRACAVRRDLRLIVLGDGSLRPSYEAMVPTDLKPYVHFAGFINAERPSYYASADVLCVPASISSFGITLLEALACGAPIICSDIEGFRDVVQDGRDCVMFPVHDTDALADRLIMLLGDASLRLRLAETGLARVQRYAWPRVTDAILRVYESVLATPRPAEVTTP